MCKHVAAVLYGIGARLDRQPEPSLPLAQRGRKRSSSPGPAKRSRRPKKAPAAGKVLGGEDLAALFGLEMRKAVAPMASEPKRAKARPARRSRRCRLEGQGPGKGQCRKATETAGLTTEATNDAR